MMGSTPVFDRRYKCKEYSRKKNIEYLINCGKAEKQQLKNVMQDLCTKVAEHMPVTVSWRPNDAPAPWGCILSSPSRMEYCDQCPVKDVCPNDCKEWSK